MAVGLEHLEARLKPNQFYHYGLNRRALLSTLAVLPTLVGLRPISARAQGQTDALPSWNDGATKKAITDFVSRVTVQGGSDFVPPVERQSTSPGRLPSRARQRRAARKNTAKMTAFAMRPSPT